MNRVANSTNIISWTFNAGDPSPVNIIVVNSDNATLNGPFFIANNADLTNSVRCDLISLNVIAALTY